MSEGFGEQKLWLWFGLSYASWLTLPRVLMHEMPDDWQEQMAQLLEEFDREFPDWNGQQLYVTAKKSNGRFAKLPQALCQYRRPMRSEIEKLRRG